jgi:integrase
LGRDQSDAVLDSFVPVPISDASFLDFEEYEAILQGAASEPTGYLVLLLDGEAGLRCGEMMALASADVNWTRRQLCVQRSDWRGEVTMPKGGRLRYVPMMTRLATTLKQHRHLRSGLVLRQDGGGALTQRRIDGYVRRAARRAGLRSCGPHVLRHTFCSHLAMRGAPARAIQELAGHPSLRTTMRYMHLSPAALDSAIRLLESTANSQNRGDIVETVRA